MPGPSTIPHGNIGLTMVLNTALNFTPTTIAGTTGSEVTATVNGLLVGDFVAVNKPAVQSNIGIDGVRVSANNVLAINFGNDSTATQTPTAGEVYTIFVVRSDNNPASPPSAIE